MPEQIYLGIDLGAESGRVMAGLWNGSEMRLDELHRFPNVTVDLGGSLRWDLLRLWSDIQHGLALAARRYGNAIISIGVDTWALDYVLLSKSGEMLGQPHCYRDHRTQGVMEEVLRSVGREEVFAQSGLQFLPFNTLYQLVAHQRQSPETLAAAETLLMIPDFINWCLSGAKTVEFTNATTTQFFHPTKRDWSLDLLHRLGLPTKIFPEIILPGSIVGSLRQSVIDRTGLRRLPIIAPATHDTGSAVAAVPTLNTGRTNWAYISSGTWSLMGVETPSAVLGPKALEFNVTNEGGVDGTYRVLKNIMGLWLVQRCKHSFDARGLTHDYGQLVTLAEQAQPLRSLIDPDDRRFLSPADMPNAIQEFCRETGQPVPTTEGQLVRCCLESLALKYAVVLDQLEQLTGERAEVIHIVGGGSRNILLNLLAANACQRPVLAGPVEATVLGNLLVQARAAGEVASLAEIRESIYHSVVPASSEPVPAETAMWQQARQRFAKLLQPAGPDKVFA
jgi:rhamnulokinase